jgi:hypothetical protein
MFKSIAKLAAISSLLVFTTMGCLPVIVAGIGAAGTVMAARHKMEGDVKKAEEIEAFRDAIVTGLEHIAEELETTPETERVGD